MVWGPYDKSTLFCDEMTEWLHLTAVYGQQTNDHGYFTYSDFVTLNLLLKWVMSCSLVMPKNKQRIDA